MVDPSEIKIEGFVAPPPPKLIGVHHRLGINNGKWKFPEQMGLGKKQGFVYVIRDNFMKRFYLGKKMYTHKVRGTNYREQSNWRTYQSSSNTMKEMLRVRPIDEEFEFICIEEYERPSSVTFAETWSLCVVEALHTDQWYNGRIEEVTWKITERISQRHKDRLRAVMAMEKFEE
jgi:hypothetical protein